MQTDYGAFHDLAAEWEREADWSASVPLANAAPAVSNVSPAFDVSESETFVRAFALMAGRMPALRSTAASAAGYFNASRFCRRGRFLFCAKAPATPLVETKIRMRKDGFYLWFSS
ncbi:MAG: hypothetical protein JSS81_19765 [Acidobacteria bacterium]|nr:hypothetical protein [Acidobacteriota bacterium]